MCVCVIQFQSIRHAVVYPGSNLAWSDFFFSLKMCCAYHEMYNELPAFKWQRIQIEFSFISNVFWNCLHSIQNKLYKSYEMYDVSKKKIKFYAISVHTHTHAKKGSELRPLLLNKANMMIQSKYFPHFLFMCFCADLLIYTIAMSFLL